MLEVDALQQTTVPGLYAAGDAAAGMPSVANAIASGSRAASGIVHDLAAAATAVPAA
jgi:thioredoxin reductase